MTSRVPALSSIVPPLRSCELRENTSKSSVDVESSPTAPSKLHRQIDGYEPTPLRDCPGLADQLGVARVLVKDESRRLGTKSFKILGASWAIYRELAQRVGVYDQDRPQMGALQSALRGHSRLELVAATDGNHGHAVATMARELGLKCRIYVPADMVPARQAALAAAGAEVQVVAGNYDEAVAAAAEVDSDFAVLISDTSWPGYTEIPTFIREGYSTLGRELIEQIDRSHASDLFVAVQIGVGAFASAIVRELQPLAPTILGVEPTKAACALSSIAAGDPVGVAGSLDSIMAGLNCGRVSTLAWPVLRDGVDLFAAIDDDQAMTGMRWLAREGIEAGESGAAGLAGVLAFQRQLPLTPSTTVVVVNTEGATDPFNYQDIVGSKATEPPAGETNTVREQTKGNR